jgi:heme A synthase
MLRPPSEDRRDRTLRRLAGAAVALMLIVVLASAWLRLAQPRAACPDWPGCRVGGHPGGPVAAAGPASLEALARATHRGAASAMLLVAIAMTAMAWARRARDPATLAHALALTLVTLALAALGVVTPGSRATPVLLGNQIGGLLLLALTWRLLRRLQLGAAGDRPAARALPPPAPALARSLAAIGALAWLVQAGAGALSGGGRHEDASVTHLALALVALPLAVAAAWAARRQGRRAEGGALLALVALQAVLGAASAAGSAGAPLVLAHAAAAAAGVALLAGLTAAAPASHRV